MNKYPAYLIYSVHVDSHNPSIIDKVKALYHYNPDSRINTTREMTKHQVIDLIRAGEECKTGVKDAGSYRVVNDVHVIKIYGEPFLKVKKSEEAKDDLGALEKY